MSTGSRDIIDLPFLESFDLPSSSEASPTPSSEPAAKPPAEPSSERPAEPSSEPAAGPSSEPAAGPSSADSAAIAELLGRVDQDLVRLVQYRTDLARRLVARRVEEGGLAYEHEQELAVVRRFRPLGPDGQDLARLLLRQAR